MARELYTSQNQKASRLNSLLQLLILGAFAVVQPLLGLLSDNAEFFVIRRSQPLDIFALVALIAIVLPLGLWLLELGARAVSQNLGRVLHVVFSFALLCLIFSPFLQRLLPKSGYLLIGLASVLTLLSLFLYQRFNGIRLFLSFLAPVVLLFPALFFINPQVAKLTYSGSNSNNVLTGNNSDVPVVVIIFDGFPLVSLLDEKEQVDPVRYPNFAKLADTSHFFTNATAVSAWTQHAVPAILTGKVPRVSPVQMPNVIDHPQNLFTILGGSHQLHAFEQVTHLCPDSLCTDETRDEPFAERFRSLLRDLSVAYLHIVIPTPLTTGLPNISFSWHEFAQEKPDPKRHKSNSKGLLDKGSWADDEWLFKRFVNSIQPQSGKPSLYFLHVTFPHVPYRYLPSGKKYLEGFDRRNDKGYKKQWGSDQWPATQQYQRYLLQLGYADKWIGELLQKLEASGIFEKSLIAITADHGDSFQRREFSRRIGKKRRNSPDVLLVPLIIKLPGQKRGEAHKENVQTIDVLPSIADALDITLPSSVDGRSVFSDTPAPAEKRFFELPKSTQQFEMKFPAQLALDHVLKQKLELFGTGSSDDRLYQIGPNRELVGKSASELAAAGAIAADIALDAASDFENVKLSSNFIPAMVSGKLKATAEPKKALAVLLNGKVATTTWADHGEFAAIVAEDGFVEGKNVVQVLDISGVK